MRKYRDKEGLFIAEGQRCVMQLLERMMAGNAGLVEAVLVRDGSEGLANIIQPVLREAAQRQMTETGVPVYQLSGHDFDHLSDTESNQGILAICRQPGETSADDLILAKSPILALDSIQDPGNAGTIYRSASWFSVGGLLIGQGTVDIWHPKVVRSTAGATGSIPYCRGNLDELMIKFEANGWDVWLLDSKPGSAPIQTLPVPQKCLIVAGNEGSGLSSALFTPGRQVVRIDGDAARVESLNVASAVTIALYAATAGGRKESGRGEQP